MQLFPGNQVWVKCADREWWPAKVQPLPDSFSAFVTNSSEDCCVIFYHDPEQLYPICSSDLTQVRPFHAEESERTLLEQQLFENANVQTAVRRALVDVQIVPWRSSSDHNFRNSGNNSRNHKNDSSSSRSSNNSNVKRVLTPQDKANIIASIKANARRENNYDKVDTIGVNTNKKVKNRKRKVKETNEENTLSSGQLSAMLTTTSDSASSSMNANKEYNNLTSTTNNNSEAVLPYSVSELRNIQSLLNAVGRDTANQLRSSLAEAGVQLNHSIVRRKQVHELAERKRSRAIQEDAIAVFASQGSSQGSIHSSVHEPYHHKEHKRRADNNNTKRYSNSINISREGMETSRINDSSNSTVYQESSPYSPGNMANEEEQLGMLPSTLSQSESTTRTRTTITRPFDYCSYSEEEEEKEYLPEQIHQREHGGNDLLSSFQFTPCVSRSVLNVLRQEVFENAHRFVLSPQYRFRELLGAVHVDNNNVITTLPSPHALWELPISGIDSHRRVLLVPLTEDYEHTAGWLVPTEIDDQELSMLLFVNGLQVSVPENWHLSAAKARSAVKTAITLDITSIVMKQSENHSCTAISTKSSTQEMNNKKGNFRFSVAHRTDNALLNENNNNNNNNEDLLSLAVGFSHLIPDTELWSGIIACIFVDERTIEEIAQDILYNYRAAKNTHHTLHLHSVSHTSPPSKKINVITNTKSSQDGEVYSNGTECKCALDKDAMIDVTEAYVKIQCPLTTLQMRVPVRSVHCEHLQCMELNTVLLRCVQSNLWNCPLCDASMRPNEMVINYRLQEWIKSHTHELQRVDYVIETPPGQPLRIVYQHKQLRNVVSIDVNDEM